MKFSRFTELVTKTKEIPLNGAKAHLEMTPALRERNKLKEQTIQKRTPQNAGVMALFYPNTQQETMLVLILRKTYKGAHSGQIGFPGGREELQDASIKDTALRETYEEVGVRPSNITVIRELTKIYIPPSNFWVYPFLGYAKTPPKFRRQESEVEELILVKLEDLLNEDNIVRETLSASYAKNIDVPAFSLNNKIVWGATAMMLNETKSLLTQVL